MATYQAGNYTDPMPGSPGVGLAVIREFLFTVATALALNDIIKLHPIAKGLGLVLDAWVLDVPDLDTNASPTIQLQLGDTDTAAKFMAANTIGQAAGKVDSVEEGVAGALPVEYAAGADKDARITVSTGPATGATSVGIRGYSMYHYPGIASPL